jgi:hypothetical protein
MIGLKRFIRLGVVISVIGHAAPLLLGVLFFSVKVPDSPAPDAMVVDIVPQDEAPRFAGTPSDLRSSGSEFSSDGAGAAARSQPPVPPSQSLRQQQPPSNPQRNANPAAEQPDNAQSETAQPKMAHADAPRADKAELQTTEPQAVPRQSHPDETPDQPRAAEMMAQLALAGGPLGGGFAAPPIEATQASYDFTASFRERVSWCSAMPPGIDAGERIRVVLRVFLNRDGTLGSPPQLLEPITSEKEQALLQNSISALRKCQPYTMLPPEKYQQWKKLDLIFYPLGFLGR